MERNSKMFYQIADLIETYPEFHAQDEFIDTDNLYYDEGGMQVLPEELQHWDTVIYDGREIHCGTTQCIAGWAMILEGRKEELISYFDESNRYTTSGSVENAAAEILGLNQGEAYDMFYFMKDNTEFDFPNALRAIGDGADVHETLKGRSYYL